MGDRWLCKFWEKKLSLFRVQLGKPMSFPIRRLHVLPTRWHLTPLQRLPSFPRRCYSKPPTDSSSKLHLPSDPQEWSTNFKVPITINHRISVRNPETAASIANAFVPEGSRDKVIVEAYPGEQALFGLPKVLELTERRPGSTNSGATCSAEEENKEDHSN